jgi:hypothetical protein
VPDVLTAKAEMLPDVELATKANEVVGVAAAMGEEPVMVELPTPPHPLANNRPTAIAAAKEPIHKLRRAAEFWEV